MRAETLPPTQLVANEEWLSQSDFHQAVHHRGIDDPLLARGVRLTTLSPSLLQDLDRFERERDGVEPLEVMAASVRHAKALVVFLELAGRVLPLRLFPTQALFACPSDFLALPSAHVQQMRVVRLDPGTAYEPAYACADEPPEITGPLMPLLWKVAMQGRRIELLPEIDGKACYRVSAMLNIAALPARDAAAQVLRRMRRNPLSLNQIAAHPGIGPEMACRLLNAVYLQAGLITLRSSPAARTSSHSASFESPDR